MSDVLDGDIKILSGIDRRRALLLNRELGIFTLRDFLYHFPYKYIDRTKIYYINQIVDEAIAYIQIKARVTHTSLLGAGHKRRFVVYAQDATAEVELVWFAGIEYIQKKIELGREYLIFGKPTIYNGRLQISHPEMDIPMAQEGLRKMRLMGIYRSTEKLNKANAGTKTQSIAIHSLWEIASEAIHETLPDYLLSRYRLMPLRDALFQMHFPNDEQTLRQAEHRIKFEEFLILQLSLLKHKNIRTLKSKGFIFPTVGDKFNTFYHQEMPFELTGAQKKVLREIRRDTTTGKQMNRLIQGDVGSGKTIVAFMCMLLAIDNGFQACMMAPTEILATQHYHSIAELADKIGIKVDLLTGSTRKKERKRISEELMSSRIKILIGTHALIEECVRFDNLGLVVIDEQHRFGVEQRARLWEKNHHFPHVLVMSATPIPRTLAMTIYGDLDISIIDELPPGRKEIKTLHFYDSRRLQLFGFIRDQIALGRQVYVVYPLIKESEKLDYKNIEDGYESIVRAFPPPDYVTAIVHGQMSAADKEIGMNQFKRGQAHIMVATSVIEVGVNVPNATVMVIESAERFGLSQLHQLRGRVGRGSEQSFCILMSGDKLSSEGRKRLAAMVETTDGFRLAELDLKLRGAGNIDGTQQSGNIIDLKLANINKDNDLLVYVREVALSILESDPFLEQSQNQRLSLRIKAGDKMKKIEFSKIS